MCVCLSLQVFLLRRTIFLTQIDGVRVGALACAAHTHTVWDSVATRGGRDVRCVKQSETSTPALSFNEGITVSYVLFYFLRPRLLEIFPRERFRWESYTRG